MYPELIDTRPADEALASTRSAADLAAFAT
jgi:hypothetical protein